MISDVGGVTLPSALMVKEGVTYVAWTLRTWFAEATVPTRRKIRTKMPKRSLLIKGSPFFLVLVV
jgi:hypothetical protein